jgi:8-oxo-dGTP diphosphatase
VSVIVVSAAVIIDAGRVLLSQRKAGTHLEGKWEFPGGKVEEGEDPRAALRRELVEELGIDAEPGAPIEVTFHRYPTKSVLLLFFEASLVPGSPPPRPLDVAAVRWAEPADLRDEDFPPADLAVLERVRRILASSR